MRDERQTGPRPAPRHPARRWLRRAAPWAALLLLLAGSAAWAQDTPEGDPAGSAARPSFHLGLRLGASEIASAADRVGDVFTGTEPRYGVDLEARFERWFLRASGVEGSWTGDESLFILRFDAPAEGPFTSRSRWTATLGELTLAARLPLGEGWEAYSGGGPSVLTWEDSNLLRIRDGAEWGGHLLVGVRRQLGPWTLGSELVFTRVPGVPDDLGGDRGAEVEEDVDLLAVDLTASYRLWPREDGSDAKAAGRGSRFGLRATGVYVHPTANYSRTFGVNGPGSTLVSDQDGDFGWGAGLEVRVAPFASLVAEGFRATIPTGSTITTRRPEGDFVLRASDELDVEGATLSLALDVWRGRRTRVTAGPVVAYLSYVGIERGDYDIGIDRHGYNLGAFAGLEVGLAGRWAVVSEIEHLSLVRIDGFESGFEIDPVLLSTGLRFGW